MGGVEKSILLSLRLPKDSRQDVRVRNDWVLQISGRLSSVIPFVTIIEDDNKASLMFAKYLDRGARGLKLIGWHSNYIKQFDYDLRSPSLVDTFRVAADNGCPVLVHLWVGYSE